MVDALRNYAELGYEVNISIISNPPPPHERYIFLGKIVSLDEEYQISSPGQSKYSSRAEILKSNEVYILETITLDTYSKLCIPEHEDAAPDAKTIGYIYINKREAIKKYGSEGRLLEAKIQEECKLALQDQLIIYQEWVDGKVYDYKISRNNSMVIQNRFPTYGYERCVMRVQNIIDELERKKKLVEAKITISGYLPENEESVIASINRELKKTLTLKSDGFEKKINKVPRQQVTFIKKKWFTSYPNYSIKLLKILGEVVYPIVIEGLNAEIAVYVYSGMGLELEQKKYFRGKKL